MRAISWKTRADSPHEHDPRYGFVGLQLRFVVVFVGDWHAEDRATGKWCNGTFEECDKWCWDQLPAESTGVAGQYCKGSGV